MPSVRALQENIPNTLSVTGTLTGQLAASVSSPIVATVGGVQLRSSSSLSINLGVVGAGGIDTGSVAAGTYSIYLVNNSSNLALIASLSSVAPAGFSGYKMIGRAVVGAGPVLSDLNNGQESDPIGSVKSSMLNESQFQSLFGSGWILADGRNVSGTRYARITAATTIPDLRGMVLRGKNNGRSDGNQDPAGERSIGAFQDQATAKNGLTASANSSSVSGSVGGSDGTHTHSNAPSQTGALQTGVAISGITDIQGSGGGTAIVSSTGSGHGHSFSLTAAAQAITVGAGDAETRMRNVAVNHFIKVN